MCEAAALQCTIHPFHDPCAFPASLQFLLQHEETDERCLCVRIAIDHIDHSTQLITVEKPAVVLVRKILAGRTGIQVIKDLFSVRPERRICIELRVASAHRNHRRYIFFRKPADSIRVRK